MIRITKTYDGYAVWKETPVMVGATEITANTLVTEFTNLLSLFRYLNLEMFKDELCFGEFKIEINDW